MFTVLGEVFKINFVKKNDMVNFVNFAPYSLAAILYTPGSLCLI